MTFDTFEGDQLGAAVTVLTDALRKAGAWSDECEAASATISDNIQRLEQRIESALFEIQYPGDDA